MKRRELLGYLGAALLAAPPAFADSIEDALVAQLRAQGYTRVSVSRTLLRRVRIEAESPTRRREIIVNPRTGEILRDYWEIIGAPGTGLLQSPVILETDDEPDGTDDSGVEDEDDSDGDDDGDSSESKE